MQTRHIISTINEHRVLAKTGDDGGLGPVTAIHLSGGQARNRALVQLLADVCDVEVVLPASVGDAVSRGAAVLGRFAAEESDLPMLSASARCRGKGQAGRRAVFRRQLQRHGRRPGRGPHVLLAQP